MLRLPGKWGTGPGILRAGKVLGDEGARVVAEALKHDAAVRRLRLSRVPPPTSPGMAVGLAAFPGW